MSNIPSFKVNSKPTITQQEFESNKKEGGGNFLSEPGTYDMVIKAVTFNDSVNAKDSAWIGAQIQLETPDGKGLRYFLEVPTECRNGFLFGPEKAVWPLEKLQKFFRGLGIQFDYDNGMRQVGALFGDTNKMIGKTIKTRLGYNGPHAKYNGKDDYIFVDKDHVTRKLDGNYATKEALNAACAEAGIKRQLNAKGSTNADFIQVLEIFPSKEALVDLEATTSIDIDLPF
jgi:hypothetical protein